MVFISVSKIQFESKSQQGIDTPYKIIRCLSVCQRYNLKANHNVFGDGKKHNRVFISVSKIQFESKSQLVENVAENVAGCLSVCQRYNLKANHNSIKIFTTGSIGVYQCVKDTIWKQITTLLLYW